VHIVHADKNIADALVINVVFVGAYHVAVGRRGSRWNVPKVPEQCYRGGIRIQVLSNENVR
jgi:hypothetical protein